MTIESEIKQAQEKYGHFHSTHEVYGVLMEEVEEFWELVKMKDKEGDWWKDAAIKELTQIAAIATRAANELKGNKIKFV